MDQPQSKPKPIVSTYIHVPAEARISHAIDSSSFGVSASIRIGEHGENDATLFLRSAEQLDRLATEATNAAKQLRRASALREQMTNGSGE